MIYFSMNTAIPLIVWIIYASCKSMEISFDLGNKKERICNKDYM